MSYNPTSPVTGATQTGLTSPTYTLSADTAPEPNGVQHAVTALGGTQTDVESHSVSKPFTTTFVRPKTFRPLGSPSPVTGVINQVPMNKWKLITRKGVSPLSGQPNKTALVVTTIEVPAGSDLADPEDIRAMLSCHIGILNGESSGIGDSVITGIL